MTHVFAQSALTPSGWQQNVRIGFDNNAITDIRTDATPISGDECHSIILPGMPNLHSHAFQRGMAGLAESRGPGSDSFWSWRNVMYRFALTMTPDQVEAVAAQLYMEMLEAGFIRVGEFHYLHHDTDGQPYANIAEMAERIAAAASQTGIGLTLLPVFYAHSTFGGAEPSEGQRRFINSLDSYEKIHAGCLDAIKALPGGNVGVAPHSLRAVIPDELAAVTAIAGRNPKHIHVAEQVKEVEDCIAWSGARPVEWLLRHAGIDETWCLIHATHMTDDEISAMARTGAVAGLCPTTEANLGDGTFSADLFAQAGGRLGIGSDSNVLIGIADELRQLEYSQRLAHRSRNVLAPAGGSTGRSIFDHAVHGGGTALGVETGLAVGRPADFISIQPQTAAIFSGDLALDSWIFANGAKINSTWVSGIKQVEGGRHKLRDQIEGQFGKVMKELVSATP
ncbi:formimidoylglutamate deiminase [Phyllobacterium sp. SB3]|uniref:formimidoylglutamate deiminase n=1 Tax=Phyllobacterium sp. SB3 TaxID=3156073 RepID=UPI0032AFBEAE